MGINKTIEQELSELNSERTANVFFYVKKACLTKTPLDMKYIRNNAYMNELGESRLRN